MVYFMHCSEVQLNGVTLAVSDNGAMPPLNGQQVEQPVTIPAYSYGFYVVHP
jgi:hypothetical protein